MKRLMKKLGEKNNSKKGFTLVELIVVLVILAILMAIMIPAMTGWIAKAKEKQYDMTARTAYLGAQSVAAELLETKTNIAEADITKDAVEKYTGDLKLDADADGKPGFSCVVTDNVVESVTVRIGGEEATYPKEEPTT